MLPSYLSCYSLRVSIPRVSSSEEEYRSTGRQLLKLNYKIQRITTLRLSFNFNN